jgi:hypothetical protein
MVSRLGEEFPLAGLDLRDCRRNNQTPSKARRAPTRAVPIPTPTTIPVGTPFEGFDLVGVGDVVRFVGGPGVEFVEFVEVVVPVSEGLLEVGPKVMVEVKKGVHFPGKTSLEVKVQL